jgi:hypothetical protein
MKAVVCLVYVTALAIPAKLTVMAEIAKIKIVTTAENGLFLKGFILFPPKIAAKVQAKNAI